MSPRALCCATSWPGRRTRDLPRPRVPPCATTAARSRTTPIQPTPTRRDHDRAALGPGHRRVAHVRHPSAGPDLPATGAVLPVVPHDGPRGTHGGARAVVPAGRVRQQVPVTVGVAAASV